MGEHERLLDEAMDNMDWRRGEGQLRSYIDHVNKPEAMPVAETPKCEICKDEGFVLDSDPESRSYSECKCRRVRAEAARASGAPTQLIEKWIKRAENLRSLEGGYDYYKGEIICLEQCARELEEAARASGVPTLELRERAPK